ncbi:MAG: carboxylating nicotinate-nucleotide diphosphorylase [Acidobacteria bacterium]|nr:carboxylating nicotinate-nucleotide diphosphorylase [Acidobacteriota bacterium]MCI0722090.1 carboxylating nicotinate-nucleotide diphosphorylase [Acidobacteriota bacterium]
MSNLQGKPEACWISSPTVREGILAGGDAFPYGRATEKAFNPFSETDLPMVELNSQILDSIVSNAIQEDLGFGDITTQAVVNPALKARGEFIAKQDFILAGWPVVVRTFQQISTQIVVEGSSRDGDAVARGSVFGTLSGPAMRLLSGERVALNFLQRLSGIATITKQFVEAVSGTRTAILDTRKTAPGLRVLEKYAVRMGGGRNHRFGLSDGVLIKENHIALAGGIVEAVRRARSTIDHLKKIEIEVTNFEELDQALGAGADAILLDNMTPAQVKESVQRTGGRVPLEVSGGVHLGNVREYALAGVDFISVGALTHSFKSADISLELTL